MINGLENPNLHYTTMSNLRLQNAFYSLHHASKRRSAVGK